MHADMLQCTACQAVNQPDAPCCWMCWRPLRETRPVRLVRAAQPERRTAKTFGLSTLMIGIALAAVVLGVFRFSPGLAIALVVLSTPPGIATLVAAARRSESQPMDALQKLGYFALVLGAILGSMLIASIAAFLAFLAVCSALV